VTDFAQDAESCGRSLHRCEAADFCGARLVLGQAISRAARLAAELGMSFLPVSEGPAASVQVEGLLESRPAPPGNGGVRNSPRARTSSATLRSAKRSRPRPQCCFPWTATAAERRDLAKLAARVGRCGDANRIAGPTPCFIISWHGADRRCAPPAARCSARPSSREARAGVDSGFFC